MLKEALNEIILKEKEALNKLLQLLEEQHKMLVNNDVFGLEDIVARMQLCNKEVAECEVNRRKLSSGEAMSKLVDSLGDMELDKNHRSVKRLLFELKLQKDTNDMLIKQGLGFSTRMLNVMSPDRNMKTYNSYGKLSR